MPLKHATLTTLCLLLAGTTLNAAQLQLRYAGPRSEAGHEWLVLAQPDAVGAVAIEVGLQFSGGSIVDLQPNAAVFVDENPGQNPFTAGVTIGVSIHNSGANAFASLGGLIPAVAETLVMTVVTDGAGTLSLGGQNHNGFFTGARLWQGAAATDGLAASLQVTGSEADFDNDGDVDGRDLIRWQRGLGIMAGAARSQGDANADGAVDSSDLSIWRSQIGGPSAIASIPEPGTFVGALMAALMLVCRHRLSSVTSAVEPA